MCRIVGIVDFKGNLKDSIESITVNMRDSLTHGGPDDAGIYLNKEAGIALGHRRLSIIDTSSAGHQPMSNKDQTIWITYNGEIYNFLELRKELIECGYEFKSRTDTEVIIYGYEAWGIEELLFRLRGMFAFAIFDYRQKDLNLILAKDRFGIKPLYYYKDSEKFLFSSEVKAFLKSKLIPNEINLESIVRFLQLGSIPAPLTTIKDVYSLPASHYMVITKDGYSMKQYWDLYNFFGNQRDQNKFQPTNEIINKTHDLLTESVNLHLISDVPLGVFLSGGIDSSAIVSLASKFTKKLNTLSVIFEETEYSEARYAKLVAEQYDTNHHEILVKSKDFYEELPNIFNAMDQPTIDGVNTYFISKAAKEVGLTVVLSGIGGDEVFLGYKYFRQAKNIEAGMKLMRLFPNMFRNNIVALTTLVGSIFTGKNLEKLSYLKKPTDVNSYLLFRGLFTPKEIQNLLEISENEINSFGAPLKLSNGKVSTSLLESLDILDFKHYLQNQILKDTDFMSMWHAVEVRVPFLDHTLVEYVFNLPNHLKLQSNVNKPLIVNSLGNDLPKELWDRPKMGFTFPFEHWIKDNCNELMEISLNNDNLNRGFQEKMWNNFKEGKAHWSRVWGLIAAKKFNNIKESILA